MRRIARWAARAALGVVLASGASSAKAQAPGPAGDGTRPDRPEVGLRTGEHKDFGRVVLDLPPGVRASVARGGGVVTVRLEGGVASSATGLRRPRNVVAIEADGAEVRIATRQGSGLRTMRLGRRLVLDLTDAPAVAAPAPSAASPSPGTPRDLSWGQSPDGRHRAAEQAREQERMASQNPSPPDPPPAAPNPPRALPSPGGAGGTIGIAAAPAPVAPQHEAAATLPFAAATGAAALRRGGEAVVVFDERRPIDLSPLRGDRVFGDGEVTLLPAATVLRLLLPPDRSLRLTRGPAGWTVAVLPPGHPDAAREPIRAEQQDGRLRLAASAPGKVVAVPDPLGGGTLLVGTQRSGGQAMPVERRAPEFELLPTWQGVAVQLRSDDLALRAQADGFVLEAGAGHALAIAASDEQARIMAEAAHASRRFDLPALPLEALHRRLQSATLAAASAPAQARTARRREVAEALMALGMGPEMQAVTTVAAAEDTRAAADADMVGLGAIAALLAGRVDEAAGIEDQRLTGSDEVALWRAVHLARQEGREARAAAIFASAMPLLLSYPAPLRDRLLPLALETMAQGGEADAAAAVANRLADMPSLDLARALLAERTDKAAALAVYDRVAAGTDRRSRALAARRAVELRHAAGELGAARAAEALERLVYAWRGDSVEVATRLRIAELRAEAGEWRASLAGLREMLQLFPGQADAVRSRLAEVFARSLAPEAQSALSPIDLVALAEENADLMPTGPAGHALAERLADRLLALDLPARAGTLLERLVAEAPPGVGRASLGARLAALRLEDGKPADALAALSGSMVEGALPPDLLERRTLVFARAAAASGDRSAAVAALAGLGTPAALAARAALLEEAKEWPAAADALAVMVAAQLPGTGPLDDAQGRLVLRLAAAAAQAGDSARLALLRETFGGRLPAPMRDLLQVMATAPVNGVGDLARAGQEARLAAAVPGAFQALAAGKSP